jgi:serine protease AprX
MGTWERMRKVTVVSALLAALVALAATGLAIFPATDTVLASAPDRPEEATLSPKALNALRKSGPDDELSVIVTTVGPAEETDEQEVSAHGGHVSRRYGNLDGYAASVPAGSLRHLARSRHVSRITLDQPVEASNDINYATVGADIAYGTYGLDGNGVTVAVLDSGIAEHPDITGRIVTEVEIVGHEKGFADYFGHGTHVAGIIAGTGSISKGAWSLRTFKGIAPKAKLVSVRVLGADGTGLLSDVLAGIDWVISNKDLYKIRVLNLSMGHPIEQSFATDPLCQALERAWRAGVVVVVSAGNRGPEGYGTIRSPGNDPYVITVGASNNYLTARRSDDILTTYSSRGPTAIDYVVKPDLLAPGNRTVSLRATGSVLDTAHPELRVKYGEFSLDPTKATLDSPYFRLSGTSMASGVVSGMAALMIQAEPGLTPDTVKARLMKSAEKHLEYDIFAEGAGFVDLAAALTVGGTASAPALSPRAVPTSGGFVIESTGELWQNTSLWADSLIWGGLSLQRTIDLLCDAIIWGGNLSLAGQSSSGDAIIWGGGARGSVDGTLNGDAIIWGGGFAGGSGTILSAESIIWGGGATCKQDCGGTPGGDNNPPSPGAPVLP